MRTIICGGRGNILTPDDIIMLDSLKDSLPITEVVCGEAQGIDQLGKEWALSRGIPVRSFRAHWGRYGRSAGPLRNESMAKYANACIAFLGGKGTANMVMYAKHYNLRLINFGEEKNAEHK